MTTSRFSINDIPNIAELQQVNFPVPPLKARHVASIATMVCVKEAIVALEAIISSWIAASRTRCGGKPFKWLVEHDPDRLELILCELLKESHEREFYNEQFRDAWDSKKQGERWLAHLDALDFNEANLERSVEAAKVKILAQLKAQNSSRASDAAKSKNSEARAWVLDKWESRTDRGESKAAFARQYASLVKGKFKLAITSDTIQRDWLPKVEK